MISLALYNTYDPKRLHEAHIRAVARAAPLSYAYGYHLVLVGFPIENLEKFVRTVRDSTTIGRGGSYLNDLFKTGKIHVIPYPKKGFPTHFGIPVATTSKPEMEKVISPLDVARLAEVTSLILLIGLGRRGLPKETFKIARYHLDITGKRISLETCTAMGAIATTIAIYLEVLKWKNGKRRLHGSSQSLY